MADAKLLSFLTVISVLIATSSLLLIAEARLLKEEAFSDGEAGRKQFLPTSGAPGFPGFTFPPFPFPLPPLPPFPGFILPPLPEVPVPPIGFPPPVIIPILPPSPSLFPPPTQA